MLGKPRVQADYQREKAIATVMTVALVGAAVYYGCKDGGCGGGGGQSYPSQCCKVCSVGKACGDTCIQSTDICHVGQGCACNTY